MICGRRSWLLSSTSIARPSPFAGPIQAARFRPEPDRDFRNAVLVPYFDATISSMQANVQDLASNGSDAQKQVQTAILQEQPGDHAGQQPSATSLAPIQSVITSTVDAAHTLSATIVQVRAAAAALHDEPLRV